MRHQCLQCQVDGKGAGCCNGGEAVGNCPSDYHGSSVHWTRYGYKTNPFSSFFLFNILLEVHVTTRD